VELSSDPVNIITSFPIQWQIYGSGPRLAWERIIVFVLAVVLCSLCLGLWQMIVYWMAPGDWTEVPGLMVLVQGSGPLQDIKVEEKANESLYFVTEESKGRVMLGNEGVRKRNDLLRSDIGDCCLTYT
jgi:hypothetical protein